MQPVVAVASGGSIQAAIDALPAGGGTNFFFRDLEFHGGGKSGNALQLQRVRDVVFENCRFAEFFDRTSKHGADEHLVFDCNFVGSARFAIYLDGAHGSGAIGCRFAGRNDAAMEGFTSGCVLNLTNDDFTEDIDDSGMIDRNRRITNRNALHTLRKTHILNLFQLFVDEL